jgi:hypothetical protein
MRPRITVVRHVLAQDLSKVLLIANQDVVVMVVGRAFPC